MFGLIILTFLIYTIHFVKVNLTLTEWFVICYVWVSLILFLYTLLQMSYTLVSHNFGLNILGYGYVSSNFIIICVLTTLTYTYLFRVYYVNLNTNNLLIRGAVYLKYTTSKLGIPSKMLLTYLFTMLVMYIYVLSFNPILNNICWTSLNIEIMNKWFSWLNIKLILLIVVFMLLWPSNSVINLVVYIYTIYMSLHITPFITYRISRPFYITLYHTLLLLIFLSSLYLNQTLFNTWTYVSSSNISYQNLYKRTIYATNYLVENTYIITYLYNLGAGTTNLSSSFYWFNTALDNQFFNLNLTDTLLCQNIYNHVFLYTFYVSIYDISSLTTDVVFTPLFILTIFIYTRVFKIVL